MSSIIEFRNLTFTGDQVTFDIHVNLPPGAGEWAGINLYGTFPGMNSSYFTYHTIDGESSFGNNSNSGQIDIYSTGNNLTSSGTIATFSGPASVFNDTGLSGGFNPDAWDFGDLLKQNSNTYGITDGMLLTMPSYTSLTLDDITEGFGDGGMGGGSDVLGVSLDNIRTESIDFAHYDTAPNFSWTDAVAMDINIDQSILQQALSSSGMESAQGVQLYYDFGGAPLLGLGSSSDPSLTNWVWSEKMSDLSYVGSQYAYSMKAQADDYGDGSGVISLWFYENADLESLLASSDGSLGTIYFDPDVFMVSDFDGGFIVDAEVIHHTDQFNIAQSAQLYGTPDGGGSGGGEGPTPPSGPEYSHIGNSSGGTSGVDTSTSNYDASTGVVEFNVSGSGVLTVNNDSLYVDNGDDDTGASDQTMGVYLDMGLGLASALVPSANTVTTPEAGVIKELVETPYVYFTNAHYTVSADGTHDVVSFDVILNADAFKADYSNHIIGPVNFSLNDEIAGGVPPSDGTLYNSVIIDDTWVTVEDPNMGTGNGGGSERPAFQWFGDDYFRVNQHYSMQKEDGSGLDYGLTDSDAAGTHLLGSYSIAYDSTYSGYDSSWKPSATGTDFDGSNIISLFSENSWSSSDRTTGMIDIEAGNGGASISEAFDLVYIDNPFTTSALDGTVSDVTALPWVIELTGQDDVFIGRDAVYNSDTQHYDLAHEVIIATEGYDEIDGGGGLNTADFSQLDIANLSGGIEYSMATGEAAIGGTSSTSDYSQNWYGFQSVTGTDNNDYIYGTGEEDNSAPEDFMHFHFGDEGHIHNTAGSNIIVSGKGDDDIYANGGSDFIVLNGESGDYSYAQGGSGADVIAFGLEESYLYGHGGNYDDYVSYGSSSGGGSALMRDTSSSGGSSSGGLDVDDFYNDGVSYAGWDLKHDDEAPTGTVTFTVGTQIFTMESTASSWIDFENQANEQINLDLGNLVVDGDTVTVADGRTAYKYVEVLMNEREVYDSVNDTWEYVDVPAGMRINLAHGIEAPSGLDGYYISDEERHHDGNGTPAGAPTVSFTENGMQVSYGANLYAPSMAFVEGTGDDDDVFLAYDMGFGANDDGVDHGIEAINGDELYDLDIGQNSLSLAADAGETIYFATGLIDQAATQINVTDESGYGYYTANVTLTDVDGNTANFDLYDLNGPTTALYGDQTYQLVAVWEDVSFNANFKDVGIGTHYDASNGATQLTGLTFEWQGLGEKVGSDEVDMLTGSNGSNTFQAYGGDDVLNGAGGGDTYQFTGAFGNDKVLDFGNTGTDILQIGASVEDVWLERMGRRGDELMVTVNDGANTGTISVGRQFNPYTTIAAVEEIHFGFNGTTSEDVMEIGNGMYGGDIQVLKDGEESFHVHGDESSSIYLNANEGDATVSISWRDILGDSQYIGLELDYGTHEDHFQVEIMSGGSAAGEGPIGPIGPGEPEILAESDGSGTGALHTLLSKNAITVDTAGSEGISVTQNSGVYEFRDEMDTLLFALETIDASNYGA